MRLEVKEGDRFGRLTVIREAERRVIPSGQPNRVFLCKCDCGKEKEIRLGHLNHGKIISCGCLFTDGRTTKEELALKKVYRQMVARCKKEYFESHLYYFKGIKVCELWLNDKISFIDWSLCNGYKKGLQIDRRDNAKGYSPDNCRWVTPIVNGNNKDNTTIVEYYGKGYPFMELIRLKGRELNAASIRTRIKRGWSIEDAFDTSTREGNYKKSKTDTIS